MFYEINVSLYGKHLFATHQRSLCTLADASNLYFMFKEKFPEEEGFKISVKREQVTGEYLDEAELDCDE